MDTVHRAPGSEINKSALTSNFVPSNGGDRQAYQTDDEEARATQQRENLSTEHCLKLTIHVHGSFKKKLLILPANASVLIRPMFYCTLP